MKTQRRSYIVVFFTKNNKTNKQTNEFTTQWIRKVDFLLVELSILRIFFKKYFRCEKYGSTDFKSICCSLTLNLARRSVVLPSRTRNTALTMQYFTFSTTATHRNSISLVIYPSEIESPMIRQFRTSGFTPKGGPGLHTRVALCTSTSMSAGLAG